MSVLVSHTVAIVGASSGIGLATAAAAAREGARVIMLSRSPATLEQAAKAVSMAGCSPRDRRKDSARW